MDVLISVVVYGLPWGVVSYYIVYQPFVSHEKMTMKIRGKAH